MAFSMEERQAHLQWPAKAMLLLSLASLVLPSRSGMVGMAAEDEGQLERDHPRRLSWTAGMESKVPAAMLCFAACTCV